MSWFHCHTDYFFLELNSCTKDKMKRRLNWEEHWGNIFKLVFEIGWGTDTEFFMNGDICIMEWITDIQNTSSYCMHIRNSNVDYEGVRISHWNEGLIKINYLNLITFICTVAPNKISCTRTVAFLNNCSNEWTEDLGWQFCSCHISQISLLSRTVSEEYLEIHQCYLGWEVSTGD